MQKTGGGGWVKFLERKNIVGSQKSKMRLMFMCPNVLLSNPPSPHRSFVSTISPFSKIYKFYLIYLDWIRQRGPFNF